MTLHDAIHRLVLRQRFVRWVNRVFPKYRKRGGAKYLSILADRLDRHAPIVRLAGLQDFYIDDGPRAG